MYSDKFTYKAMEILRDFLTYLCPKTSFINSFGEKDVY